MMKWLLILLTVFASSSGDVLSAKGMASGGELKIAGPFGIGRAVGYILTRRLVIFGIICYAVAFFSLLGLLSIAQLSIAVPATALSFVIDTIGAWIFLREHVPWKRWVGVLCVTAGVILTVKSSPAPRLAGSGGAAAAAVHTNEHESGHDQGRARRLDEQRTAGEVLAKPGWLPRSDGISAEKNHHIAHP
jgi:drug/metabolite transporter (DMT)-like permease